VGVNFGPDSYQGGETGLIFGKAEIMKPRGKHIGLGDADGQGVIRGSKAQGQGYAFDYPVFGIEHSQGRRQLDIAEAQGIEEGSQGPATDEDSGSSGRLFEKFHRFIGREAHAEADGGGGGFFVEHQAAFNKKGAEEAHSGPAQCHKTIKVILYPQIIKTMGKKIGLKAITKGIIAGQTEPERQGVALNLCIILFFIGIA
jgi:hypothetical protein